METSSLLAPNASIAQKCCRQRCSLFLLVFTVLRTAVNADFAYSIDGLLCNLFGVALGSNKLAICSNTTVYVRVKIFALGGPVGELIVSRPPGSCQPLESDF